MRIPVGDLLEDYYRTRLVSGPGSFVMSVASFDDFGPAMRRKLFREIGTPELSMLDPRTGSHTRP